MATQLKPYNHFSNDPNKVDLNIVNKNKLQQVNRIRADLDNRLGEKATKEHAQKIGLPYINLIGFAINTSDLKYMSADNVKADCMGIFGVKNDSFFIATTKPQEVYNTKVYQKLKNQGKLIRIFYCSNQSLEKLHKTYLKVKQEKTATDEIKISETTTKSYHLSTLVEDIKHTSVSNILQIILSAAVENNASDIHLEPEKESYNLRFRLDGVLHTFAKLTKEYQHPLASRIKILSKLKINITNVPQDGRFTFYFDEQEIDVRVSALPTQYGYSMVLRILNNDNTNFSLSDLGFEEYHLDSINKALKNPQGMILNTGPTGSGKTTTQYAFLKELNDGERKIITLEDPIEYKLTGISQTQIDSAAGYTFSSGLRSILRQDPDVVMVGEIRDKETAEIATQASLTGHLLLSTLHTNDAAGAITRFLELGIEGYTIADSLSAVLGQRLLRKLCNSCKVPMDVGNKEHEFIKETLQSINLNIRIDTTAINLYTSKGCPECNNLGYKGRIGVYEVLSITDILREALSKSHISVQEVRRIAIQEGMVTMLQDAVLKALSGITDLKEIEDNIGI